jgi:hypothetical protein
MAEITSIEKQLDAMDESDVKDEKMHYRLHTNNWKEGGDTTQNDLLEELRRKLSEYGEMPFTICIAFLARVTFSQCAEKVSHWTDLTRKY